MVLVNPFLSDVHVQMVQGDEIVGVYLYTWVCNAPTNEPEMLTNQGRTCHHVTVTKVSDGRVVWGVAWLVTKRLGYLIAPP